MPKLLDMPAGVIQDLLNFATCVILVYDKRNDLAEQ